jgi:surface antigen
MLISLVEFVDILLQKRRSVIAAIALIIAMLLTTLLAPILQAHHAGITAQIHASYTNQGLQPTYNSPNAVTNALSQMADDAGRATGTVEIKTLSGIIWATAGVTRFDKSIARGAYTATAFTSRGISNGAASTTHAIGGSFTFTGHMIGNVFGFFSGLTHVNSLIRPPDNTPTPTITQIRAYQATIIQSGTQGVAVPSISNGTGGACDNSEGNGSYPMSWCNAPMDSIPTISYSSDPINRECTSYAYWYFTSVEGHTTFRAWGNAKYWATTSNYPTHAVPVVGAIAVETAGAYGHVAIVQALPGQIYAGQIVPAGDVLVSEMNYDWNGHFRYSYSPLSKFAKYIYP